MKRLLFILFPILLAGLCFGGFALFLSSSATGKGALQITSLPLSNVYIDGKFAGKTPLCKCEGNDLLPTGEHDVRIVPTAGDNLVPFEERVTITKSILTVIDRTFGQGAASSGFVVNLTPLPDKKAVGLFISSFPTEALVTIDGNDSGKTPELLKTLTDSDHEIVLSKSGYHDKTIHVHTNTGYQLNAIVTLAIQPTDATAAAALQNVPLTPVAKAKVVILDTPTGFLRVRYDPTLAASEEAQVKPGDSFDFVDEQTGWIEIQLPSGQKGWVSSQYASKQ